MKKTNAESVSVNSKRGVIIGQKFDGYDAYFGVPYAKVNSGNMFATSSEYPTFVSPFIANDSMTMCPQVNVRVGGTVQCLRLNIYVPQTNTTNRAVLVWFPGESFMQGCAGDYGGEHLVKHDIIVVVVNYRLGPYGFFCLRENDMPGNQGLRDQVDALRWVRKEIGAFGGDPNSVTIGGQSFGGSFVELHMLSEFRNEELFNKAIIQSGSIFLRGFTVKGYPEAALYMAKRFGKVIGTRTKPSDVVEFLSSIDPLKIINATLDMGYTLGICKEIDYHRGVKKQILSDIFHLNKLDKVNSTKILIGHNSMESLFAYANPNYVQYFDVLKDIFNARLNMAFDIPEKSRKEAAEIIKRFYLGDRPIDKKVLPELIESGSDLTVHAVDRSIDKFMQTNAEVYKYVFSYTGGSEYNDVVPNAGASHGEELKYLFELANPISEHGEQMTVRQKIITLWTNFIKYGNPTPKTDYNLGVTWKPVTGLSRPYLNISGSLSMENDFDYRKKSFWDMFWHCYEGYAKAHDD